MKFIALLIVLALMQYWGNSRVLHNDDWFRNLLGRLDSSGLPAAPCLLLATLVPAFLVGWLLTVADGWLFGLVGLGLNVLLLLYCMGRRDFEGLLNRYREQCRDGDFEAAFLLAQQEFPTDAEMGGPGNPERLHRWMKRSLVYMAFERWFAVIFYFVLFGSAGALAYRLLQLAGEGDDDGPGRDFQQRALHLVDWLPTRFLVFAFALTGDYMGSREQLTSGMQNTDSPSADILSDAAHAALGLKSTVFSDNGDVDAFSEISDWELGQLKSLLVRSAVAWILVISVLVVLL